MSATSSSLFTSFSPGESSAAAAVNAPSGGKANIILLGSDTDVDNSLLFPSSSSAAAASSALPANAQVIATVSPSASSLPASLTPALIASANVIFATGFSPDNAALGLLLKECPNVKWIQARSAGVEHLVQSNPSNFVDDESLTLTNVRGVFSSSLAEYAM
jgi:hypothetical protein